ncbi:MAG: hypothetical protein SNF92_08120 [Rikenellaceae bacterium]
MSRVVKIFILMLCIFIDVEILSAQNNIRVQGVVVSADTGKPIRNIVITHDLVLKGRSDADGRFSFVIDRDAELLFKSDQDMEYEDMTINVDGRNNIKVTMQSMAKQIEAVTVVAKVRRKPLTVEPTELEVKGNYFHITPKLHIPEKIFTTDYRYVVQPVLVDLTNDTRRNFRPMVMDGEHYDLIEHRHLNFGKTLDALEQFVIPNTIRKDNEIYPYSDSLYVQSADLGNDFKVECFFVLVTYNKPYKSSRDSIRMFEIAKGTVNPLRFFNYSISPMQLNETLLAEDDHPYLIPTGADTIYIPTPELEPRGSRGVSKIEFEVGRTTINQKIASNRESINSIQSILRDIQRNPDATLDSISMVGYASPDGVYEKNQNLADLRTAELMKVVTSAIDPYILERITLKSRGEVEPWSSVAKLAETDNKPLAEKLQTILDKTNDAYASTQSEVLRMPEYRKVIAPRYLPQLRRVSYEIDYSILRPMTYQEISDKYNKYGSDSISRFEFYRLITEEQDTIRRDTIMKRAIEKFDNFTIIANYEAVRMLQQDSVKMEILAPLFDGKYTPMAARYNQAAMALRSREYSIADSLIQDIMLTDATRHMHSVVSLFNGDYDDAYEYFSQFGGLNEVLILLSMKENEQAREKMSELMKDYDNGSNAKCHYIAAVCANRMDDLSMATMHLGIALQIDPSLEEMAKIDADVIDIYELIQLQNGGGGDAK